MASLLEQYEQATARAASSVPVRANKTNNEPISSGFVTARLEPEEVRIFNKQRVNFKPEKPITMLTVNNNILVMAMTNNKILRIDLEHPDQPDDIDLTKNPDDKVHKIFLDPNGRHLIISMQNSQDVYYLSKHSKKAKPIQKMKGYLIDSVGWNKANASDNQTGEILVGTSRGLIFETELQSGEDSRFFLQSLEQYWRQVFDLGKDGPVSVTGLEVERIPSNVHNERRYFVMATTPGRMYQFIGTIPSSAEPPVFQHVFQTYEDTLAPSFLELPGNFGYSDLVFFHPKFRSPPRNFAWMTGPGVYYGSFDYTLQAKDNITKDASLLQNPFGDKETSVKPLAVLLTEFHILLLFPDRLRVMCALNEQLVDEDVYQSRFGKLLGICKDRVKGTIWSYTNQSVFKYKVTRESRDVWRMYLDKGEFDLAKEYCKDNRANLDQVLTKQAQFFFESGRYEKSAMYFALTERSFEEIALKFIESKQTDALKSFLEKKLSSFKSQDKTQMTMLITWLIELYLNQLGELKESNQERYNVIHEQFQKFLAQSRVMECLSNNKTTVYDLIASHGDIEDMVFFAMLMQDYDRVVSHHIQHGDYKSALDVLNKPQDDQLFYKFSPVLMQHIPKSLVDAWILMKKKLDPKKLIPSLVQYDHSVQTSQTNEAVRYLEFCIVELVNQESAIHNYLLSLYAKYQPNQLMNYLQRQGDISDNVPYDLKYALRLCAEHSHKRACVHIYTTMGLYEEAVELALEVDVDLAKINANKPEDDEDLKKKLWLRIARHVVEKENNIKRAMEFLQESQLLKIEDILPFFPDFVTIDHFKEAICNSLAEYNQHIEKLKQEMEYATESARSIRSDIQEMRNKYGIVGPQQKCSTCGFPLLSRTFYLFPCQHMFHSDCLIAEVLPNLSESKKLKGQELQRKLVTFGTQPTTSSSSNALSAGTSTPDVVTRRDLHDQLRNELDDIIAADCVNCGEIMIRSIDKPFIEADEYESAVSSWL
ncbi:vacuolar protein sorting-associated protein 18 homolog [Anneissia japonica]|uniref:vacuolar protein sorting-associated protein 18 homolog n=1 Tax=Anneissia japonica TaxID=1529436 RepID=UPI00142550C3|nr:vacuolar protein sorting-associated protein 18 homolog [Anneissia japonica]